MITETQKNRYRKGDIIKVRSIWSNISPVPIWHYGVVVGHDDVVHFNLAGFDPDTGPDIHIVRTDLKAFVGPGTMLRRCAASQFDPNYEPDTIARRAISMLGTDFGGYDLFRNNCEHFAHWCACGDTYSDQVPIDEGTGHGLDYKLAAAVSRPILEALDDACDAVDRLQDATDAFFDGLTDLVDLFRR